MIFRRGRDKAPYHPLIDREPQNLPVPMGGFAAVRQRRQSPLVVKLWRRRSASLVTAIGLLMAVAGATMTLTRPPAAVYLDAGAVHIGGSVLTHPADNGGLRNVVLFTGDASLVLSPAGDGSLRASAVSVVRGERIVGVCAMTIPTSLELAEHCEFSSAVRHLAADDRFNLSAPGEWHRQYSDGRESRIRVPSQGGVIPVPFAIDD